MNIIKSYWLFIGSRYKFDLFENFDGCKDVYRQESKVVLKLQELKAKKAEKWSATHTVSKPKMKKTLFQD